jgi:hypothetical protein
MRTDGLFLLSLRFELVEKTWGNRIKGIAEIEARFLK